MNQEELVPTRDPRSLIHVYLAAPFSQWIDPATGVMHTHHAAELEAVRQALLGVDYAVYSPHFNEQWGASWLPASVCVPADFRAVGRCDALVAVLGSPPSCGVLVELGWASALGKPVVLVTEADLPHVVDGLGTLTVVAHVRLDGGRLDSAAVSGIVGTVGEVLACPAPDPTAEIAYPLTSLPLGYEARIASDGVVVEPRRQASRV
jgi:nucleoside 2-deoxyribosyltransferase